MLAGPDNALPPLNRTMSAPAARESPQVLDRWQLGGRVDDHRDVAGARDPDDRLQWERAARQVGAGDVQDPGSVRSDRVFQVGHLRTGGRSDLDEPSAGELDRGVVRDPVAALDEELARQAGEIGVAHERLGGVAAHAHDRRQEQAGGRTARDEGSLVAGQLGDAATDGVLQFVEVDERLRRLAHRLDDLGWHQRAAEIGHRRRAVDDRFDPDPPVDRAGLRSFDHGSSLWAVESVSDGVGW